MKPQIGIAPLSVLGTEPAEFVLAAAKAGYDFVGLRTRPVTSQEADLNLLHRNSRLNNVLSALKETGLTVYDTEFLAIDGSEQREIWLPMLDAAVDLQAKSLTITITDPDLPRATATIAQLVQDGKQRDLAIVLEPISYQTVKRLSEGVPVAEQTGCQLLLDTLHFHRGFGELDEINAALPHLTNLVQICDGVLAERANTREGLIEESRSHRLVPGEGDFAIAECLARVPADTPVSVEVPNPRFQSIGLDAYLSELYQASVNMIARANALR